MKRWLLLLLLVAIVAGGLMVRWSLSPRVSTVAVQSDSATTSVEGAVSSPLSFDTPYASSRTPGTVRLLNRNEKGASPILAQYLFSAVDPAQPIQAGVTIANAYGSLEDMPAVKARLSDSTRYRTSSRMFSPQGAVVIESLTDEYEAGVYWQSASYSASVVVTGTRDKAAILEELLATIVSNWQWR